MILRLLRPAPMSSKSMADLWKDVEERSAFVKLNVLLFLPVFVWASHAFD